MKKAASNINCAKIKDMKTMMKFTPIALIALFTLFAFNSQAKRDESAWKNEKNLEKQFQVFKENLRFYNNLYLVDNEHITEYHASITDSVNILKKTIGADNKEIATQKKEIETLNANLKKTQASLDESLLKEKSITAFWGNTEKGTFSGVMYTIVFLLIGACVVVVLLFLRSNNVTSETRKLFDDIQSEFDTHKKKALEREMKLNRELQTERNKAVSR